MGTSDFFVKLILTGLFSMLVSGVVMCWIIFPVSLTEKIVYWISITLCVIACALTCIGFFGMIWTF